MKLNNPNIAAVMHPLESNWAEEIRSLFVEVLNRLPYRTRQVSEGAP